LRSIGHIGGLQRVLDNDADFVTPMHMLAKLRDDNLINESAFSRTLTSRPCFADLTARALSLVSFCPRAPFVPILPACDLRFIAVVIVPSFADWDAVVTAVNSARSR